MNLFKLAWPGAADGQEDMSEQQVITSAHAWRGAGGGRGAGSGMRLDTDTGQREWAVEQEVQRLAAINPASRERLRALAQFNLSQPAIEAKPVDREAQYTAQGYAPADAAANARFDASLEQRLNARAHKARPDAVTGERIVQRYNPNFERERVVAEEKEMHALRADARQRAAAQEMPSVVRGLAQGAAGLYATSMGTIGLAGELTGNEDLRDWGLEGYRETMRGVNNIRLAPTFTGIRSTGDAVEWALENSGYAGFQAATTILSAGMGGLIANTLGKKALGEAVGIALNSTVQTFGSVYGEAAEEARRSGKPLDLPAMLAGATVSTAIDTLADRIGLNALSTQTFKGNALERLGKSVGIQVAVQGGTEAAQRVPEELGAGRAPFREGAGAQYVDDFAAGALFGAYAGTVGGLRGGEPKGTPAQHGAHKADVPVVGGQHTTPMPPVHAEQASALPEDLPAPSDMPPDRALGGAERANPPAAQGGSELAMASESAAHLAQPTIDTQGDAAQGGQAQGLASPLAAAALKVETQPTGTLAVTGDPAVIRDALLQAGVAAEDVFPGSKGALVAPRSADRARDALSSLSTAQPQGEPPLPIPGAGTHSPQVPSPTSAPPGLHIALLDKGSLSVAGDNPTALLLRLQRGGISPAELIQMGGRVLVAPSSANKARLLLAEPDTPARPGSGLGANTTSPNENGHEKAGQPAPGDPSPSPAFDADFSEEVGASAGSATDVQPKPGRYGGNMQWLKRDLARQAKIPDHIDLSKPDNVWGMTGEDLLTYYRLQGFDGTRRQPGKGQSGKAFVYVLQGHPELQEVEYHPGGGRHRAEYYKFLRHDGSEVKIINERYVPRTIKSGTVFFDVSGRRLSWGDEIWVFE
jgi:hypothetical protein